MDLGTTFESAAPRQSLRSAVVDRLRDQIIRREIKEGTQLGQDAIATQYRVSRGWFRHFPQMISRNCFPCAPLLELEVLRRSIPHPVLHPRKTQAASFALPQAINKSGCSSPPNALLNQGTANFCLTSLLNKVYKIGHYQERTTCKLSPKRRSKLSVPGYSVVSSLVCLRWTDSMERNLTFVYGA